MSAIFNEAGDRCGWPQVILFDLDGTLIDSVPDLRSSVNVLLGEDGHPPLTLDQVRSMIGNGVRKLVERAYAASGVTLEGEALDAATDRMMAVYGGRLTAETTLMPGAAEIISAYHKARVKLGVVTNKPEAASRTILDHFGLGAMIDVVVGGDTGPARKPAPDMLIYALEQVGFTAGRALLVGDSPADIGAAKAARMASVAVRGGYTNVPVEELGADIVIDSLHGLPAAIEHLKEPA